MKENQAQDNIDINMVKEIIFQFEKLDINKQLKQFKMKLFILMLFISFAFGMIGSYMIFVHFDFAKPMIISKLKKTHYLISKTRYAITKRNGIVILKEKR